VARRRPQARIGGSRARGGVVNPEPARQASYEDLLAQLESLGVDDAQSILTNLASAIFPSGFGEARQITWNEGDGAPPRAAAGATAIEARTHDEASLRAAELRYRTLVEQIPAVTFLASLGEGQNEIYVSPHIEQLLGFTQKEWLENPFLWYTQLHPDDRALWYEEFARGCRTGGPFRAECRLLARDGREVWVRGEARLIRDELGRPLFLQGVAFDITEAKLAQAMRLQEAVRSTEERYRDLVERVGAIFWEGDARSRAFTFVSAGAQQILGFPSERWIGEPDFWLTLVHPDDRDGAAAAWQGALEQGGDHEFEFRAITADHKVVWLQSKVHFPTDEEGRAKPLGIMLDITDLKLSEERLVSVLAAEQLARREAEALNRVGRLLAAELDLEPLVKQITDAGAELIGADWIAFISVSDRSARRLPVHDALLAPTFEGATIMIDDVGERFGREPQDAPGDEPRLRSYLGVPVISRSGQVLGGIFCGHSRAGTFNTDYQRIIEGFAVQTAIAMDNAQLYAAAGTARTAAEAANRAKDEFLATMSHELRTPLNAVLGWVQILQSGAVSEANRERALATINRNARAQAQIIDDLLDVSRIITGKLHLTVEPVDLVAVVDAAVEAINLAAGAKQITVRKQLNRSASIVVGDADRLRQVVSNLLTNAVKFTPTGGRIDIRLDAADGLARIRIADNGQGIDPAFLPHVFDRFWQADSSTTRKHGGLGLGLAIVRHIMEMHGGRVSADSPGKGLGATFTIELPLAVTSSAAAPDESADPSGGHNAALLGSLENAFVLVVDDEVDARDLVADVFTRAGAKVACASSATDALRIIKARTPQLLVCDIGMPERDGYDLLREIRALDGANADIPVVALTAYARDEDRQRALGAGFQVHVAKPFDADDLLAVAARLVSETRPRRGK
jgi:PAS domain S-box-containing protein